MKPLHIFFLSIAAVLLGCGENEIDCPNRTTVAFCESIGDNDHKASTVLINSYLKSLPKELSPEEQLERFKDWLTCASCVTRAEILCTSCVETNPPKSKVGIRFTAGEQDGELVVDISMTNPIQLIRYND